MRVRPFLSGAAEPRHNKTDQADTTRSACWYPGWRHPVRNPLAVLPESRRTPKVPGARRRREPALSVYRSQYVPEFLELCT